MISKICHNPGITGGLGLLNIVVSNGNYWMLITGGVLLVIAAMDILEL